MMNMTGQTCSVRELFAQLGLASDEASIEQFFQDHAPLPESIDLWNAPWWNSAQSQLLQDCLKADSDWAMAVDELNTRLRKKS